MNFEEKTIESEYLYRGKVVTLRKDKIEQYDGKQYMREIVEHNGGVGIVAITAERKLILVSQFRKPFNEVLVEIPAGKLEINEEPYECAVRELQEETGYIPLSLELMTTIYPSPGFLSEKLYIYFCRSMVKGEVNFDEGENILSHYIDFEEALEKVYSGEIKDAKTVIGILMAKKYI